MAGRLVGLLSCAALGLGFYWLVPISQSVARTLLIGLVGALAVAILVVRLSRRAASILSVLALVCLVPLCIGAVVAHDKLFDSRFYPFAEGLFATLLVLPFFAGALALLLIATSFIRRYPLAAVAAGLVAAGAAVLPAALAGNLRGPPEARFDRIDENRGEYGGVAIGDSSETMTRMYGPGLPRDENAPIIPTGVSIDDEIYGPYEIPINDWRRYPDVVVYLRRGRVAGWELTSPGAKTNLGIGIGDSIDDVKTKYPQLTCGTGDAGEDFPDPFHYCTGEISPGVYIWFGGDRISDITVLDRPLA